MNRLRTNPDLGLLILRLVVGFTFFFHGYQKVFTMGVGTVTTGFTQLGIPLPAVAAAGISFLELLGGIALMLGLFTRVLGVLFVCDMIGAIFFVHFKNGYSLPNGYEFVLLLAAGSAALVFAGAGRWSIDARMGRPTPAPTT